MGNEMKREVGRGGDGCVSIIIEEMYVIQYNISRLDLHLGVGITSGFAFNRSQESTN